MYREVERQLSKQSKQSRQLRVAVINRGTVLVIAMAGAGLMAASVAVWYQHRQTRRALDLWGPAAAQRIERAGKVDLVELDGGRTADGAAGDMAHAEAAVDISHAPGVLHFRRSLLQDANFDWDAENDTAMSDNDWDYAARFSDEEGNNVVVLFDLNRGVVANRAAADRVVRVTEKMSEGLRRFFDEILND